MSYFRIQDYLQLKETYEPIVYGGHGSLYVLSSDKDLHYKNESGTWNVNDKYTPSQYENAFLSASTSIYSGDLTDNQIAYGNDDSQITGSSGFYWNDGIFRALTAVTIVYNPGHIIAVNSVVGGCQWDFCIGYNIIQDLNTKLKMSIGANHAGGVGIWTGNNLSDAGTIVKANYYGDNITSVGHTTSFGKSLQSGYVDLNFGYSGTTLPNSTSGSRRFSLGISNYARYGKELLDVGISNQNWRANNQTKSFTLGMYTRNDIGYGGIIGFGINSGGTLLQNNDIHFSTAFGSNSSEPTTWITGGDGSRNSQGQWGIRTASIDSTIHVKGEDTLGVYYPLILTNSNDDEIFTVNTLGDVVIDNDIDVTGNLTATTISCDDVVVSGSTVYLGEVTLKDTGRNFDISNGGIIHKNRSIVADYTIGSTENESDYIIIASSSEETLTITLPSNRISGHVYIVKNISESNVVSLQSVDLIDGVTDVDILAGESIKVCSDEKTWYILENF